jgi:hypothetical protein
LRLRLQAIERLGERDRRCKLARTGDPCMTRFCAPLLAGSILILAAAAPVAAQEKTYRSADAVTGKTLRLGIYANVSKDCVAGPLPEIKVVTSPKNGALQVKDGKVKPGTLARCPKLEVPVQGVFYESNAKFTGVDEVAYEVKHTDGKVQSFTLKINVAPAAKPAAKPGAKPGAIDL